MRGATHFYTTLILLAGSASVSFAQTATTTTSDTGVQTGKRIGNIVSSAISTAFPEVDKVIKAIWPQKDAKPVTQSQATSNLQAAKATADAAQKQNLTQLTAFARDLSVSGEFLTAFSKLSTNMTAMQAMLESQEYLQKDYAQNECVKNKKEDAEKLSRRQIDHLQDRWNKAFFGIQTLESPDMKVNIASLDDEELKTKYSAVVGAIEANAENITEQLEHGRGGALRKSLASLHDKVSGIAPETAQIISDIGASLTEASQKIAAGTGGGQSGSLTFNPGD